MTELNQFDVITAVFNPQRTDNLFPDAREMIGKSASWMASWIIEDGEYAGQWAMLDRERRLGWVPLCDLSDIKGSGVN